MKKEAFGRVKRWNQGFSLVELIVVIAIMGILVGVAVPVYTSYITKSQKAADTQLVDEIKRAVEIKLIADAPADFAGGVVITLSEDGAAVTGGSEADQAWITQALSETFGDGWAGTLTLKYDGWESGTASVVSKQYSGSSFEGKETELLGQVQVLADALSSVISGGDGYGVIGDQFQSYLDACGVDSANPTAVANAAVLYAASVTADAGEEFDEKIADTFVDCMMNENGNGFFNVMTQSSPVTGSGFGDLAAVYALCEALFQYTSEDCPEALAAWHAVSFDEVTDLSSAYTCLTEAWSDACTAMAGKSDDENFMSKLVAYLGYETPDGEVPGLLRDAQAYYAVMQAITDSEGVLLNRIDGENLYAGDTVSSLLTAYLTVGTADLEEGELAVIVNGSETGFAVLSYPMDYIG